MAVHTDIQDYARRQVRNAQRENGGIHQTQTFHAEGLEHQFCGLPPVAIRIADGLRDESQATLKDSNMTLVSVCLFGLFLSKFYKKRRKTS
jgi:hypothetical protein